MFTFLESAQLEYPEYKWFEVPDDNALKIISLNDFLNDWTLIVLKKQNKLIFSIQNQKTKNYVNISKRRFNNLQEVMRYAKTITLKTNQNILENK